MASDESVGRRTVEREGSWAVFQFPEIFASIEGNPFLNWQNEMEFLLRSTIGEQ